MQGWWSPRASADGPEQHVGEEREAEVGGLEKKVLDQQTEIGRLRAQLQRMETDLLSLGAPSQPPALLPRKPLSKVEGLIDERIRTLCLVVCALAVLYFAMWTLSDVLILFFLAVALKYLLTPLIDFLSCRHPRSVRYADRCPVQLGRKWAVLFALLIAVVVLLAVSFIVANSLSSFAARAGASRDPSNPKHIHSLSMLAARAGALLFTLRLAFGIRRRGPHATRVYPPPPPHILLPPTLTHPRRPHRLLHCRAFPLIIRRQARGDQRAAFTTTITTRRL
jgi:hypothetical protein